MFLHVLAVLLASSVLNSHNVVGDDDVYWIETNKLPDDMNFMPVLANGHLGFSVYNDAIFMNGIYNGRGGRSHRARIPNWANFTVSISVENPNGKQVIELTNPSYALYLKDGYFRSMHTATIPATSINCAVDISVQQRMYTHRYYDRALVYELLVQRAEAKESLDLILKQKQGEPSMDIDFTEKYSNFGNNTAERDWLILEGVTREMEQTEFQPDPIKIYVVCSDTFQENIKRLSIPIGQKIFQYRFIITADRELEKAYREMKEVMDLTSDALFQKHVSIWKEFWSEQAIIVEGNLDLSRIINAGIFYLSSSLPSPSSFQPPDVYFGLSPTGLGRGNLETDYLGHNFWDTETWMLPVVEQFSSEWSRRLLQYRYNLLRAAQYNAHITGYKGARFPWESAYTGTEVTQPCCPQVAKQEVHISADVVLALERHYSITNDREWLCWASAPLATEVAKFIESRVEWSPQYAQYHVNLVMGPDEDHANVNDSVFTNVAFKMALEFAVFADSVCNPSGNMTASTKWLHIARHLCILYDSEHDYHPEYDGYKLGHKIKQADVILLSYPLQYAMNSSTHLQDLLNYETVTRESGPAMTWSMMAINFLRVNDTVKADKYFERSFQNYVRSEFKIWSETKVGYKGSANFLTGVGGFLQAIYYGYAGLHYRREGLQSILEIHPGRLLPGSRSTSLNGITFAGAKFRLEITNDCTTIITCTRLGGKDIEFSSLSANITRIFMGFTVGFKNEIVHLYSIL